LKAILLAAGKGERFYPFSHFRPKAMFPICNRPLLEWSVERLVAAGVTDIGVVIGHRGGRLRNHFGDGNRFGCEITYIEQREQLGTADAVCAAKGYVGADDFIVVHGDLFIGPEAIPQLLEAYTGKQSVAGIHQSEELNKQIRAEVNRENNITSYTWKPRSDNGIALSGIYIFQNAALGDLANTSGLLPQVQNGVTPAEGYEIADALPLMHREGRAVGTVQLDGPVIDMDMPWQPLSVCRIAAREMANELSDTRIAESAEVHPDAEITGPIFVDEGARISRHAVISGPVWIGKETHIHEGSQISSHTVIGDQCRIGPFAKVSGFVGDNNHITFTGEFSGVILQGGRITHHMQIAGIFGEGAEFGAGTQVGTLRFDDGPTEVIVNGIRHPALGFSGALFGDYARTGVSTILMPGRIVGACSMIGPGVVLMRNVPPHKAVILKQELQEIDWGPEIYDH